MINQLECAIPPALHNVTKKPVGDISGIKTGINFFDKIPKNLKNSYSISISKKNLICFFFNEEKIRNRIKENMKKRNLFFGGISW